MIDITLFSMYRKLALFSGILFLITPVTLYRALDEQSLVLAIITGATLMSGIFFATVSYTFRLMADEADDR